MSQASNYLETKLLEHIHGIAAFTAPATVYLALHTADPTDAASGAEVSGGSYARKAVTNDATEWSRSSQTVSNINEHNWPTATANWGTVTHWAIWDAASGGNMLVYGALTNSVVVNSGGTFRLAATKLTVTFSFKSNYLSQELLDHVFGIGSWSAPATVYQALFTSNPTDAGGGTEVASTGAYSRAPITNDGTQWSRSDNIVSNINNVSYAVATGNWGIVTGRALFDAGSGGNMICWSPLVSNQTINTDDQARFLAGQIRQTLD